MKNILILIVSVFICSKVTAQTSNCVISIGQVFDGGSFISHSLIGTNKKAIEKAKKDLDLVFATYPVVVSDKSFKVIKNYVAKNCYIKSESTKQSQESFVIQILDNGKKTMCRIPDFETAKPYFERLKSQLKGSCSANSCYAILKEIDKIEQAIDNSISEKEVKSTKK